MISQQGVFQRIEEIASELPQKIRELQKADLAYNLRFWDLILHSGMGTIAAKEAEANLTCNEEGLLEPVQMLRADVRALYHEKDCYIVLAKGLKGEIGAQPQFGGEE